MLAFTIIISIVVLVCVANFCLGLVERKWEKELTSKVETMSAEELDAQIKLLFDELEKGFSVKKSFEYEFFAAEKKKRQEK